MNAYTTHRHEHADVDSRFEIEFVRRILKDIENDLVVIGALGRRREPKRKLRLKISQYSLIRIGRRMMRLVDDQIRKFIGSERI